MTDFIFLGFKITVDSDCSHENKRRLLLGRKAVTNLDRIFKSRDITLPTKVHIAKAMVFPVCVLAAQLCLTCNSMDYSLPGSSVHGILLQWLAILFSRVSSQPRDYTWADCRQIPYHLSYQGSPLLSNGLSRVFSSTTIHTGLDV